MRAVQGITLESLNRKMDPAETRVKRNLELLLLKMNNFTGADRDKVRALCAGMFPRKKGAKDVFPCDEFLSIINSKFAISLSKNDLIELLSAMGMETSESVQPYRFFLGVKNTENLSKPYWTQVREEQMQNEHDMIRKIHPASFERAFAAAQHRADQSSSASLLTVEELKDIMKSQVEQFITNDIDRSRQLSKLLDIKNQKEGMSRSQLKKVMFSKFGFALNDKDIDRLFHHYQTHDGKIDFKSFVANTLGEKANMVLSFASGEDSTEKKRIKEAQRAHLLQQESLITVWTVKDVKKILNMKISEISSRETDQFRQVFKRLSSNSSITKQEFFKALKVNFQMNLSDDLIQEVFDCIDTNRDGYVDLTEFVAFLKDENRGRTAFPMTPVQEKEDAPAAPTIYDLAFGNKHSLASRKKTSKMRRRRGSRSGTSMSNLVNGAYNPASAGRKTHTSSGARLVCTPPPKSDTPMLPQYTGRWGKGKSSNNAPSPLPASGRSALCLDDSLAGARRASGLGLERAPGTGDELDSMKPSPPPPRAQSSTEKMSGLPPKRPSPPTQGNVISGERPGISRRGRSSPSNAQIMSVETPPALPQLPESPRDKLVDELTELFGLDQWASSRVSSPRKNNDSRAAGGKRIRTKLTGTGKLKPLGMTSNAATPIKPTRPLSKASSRMSNLSRKSNLVSPAKFFQRNPNIAANLSKGVVGSRATPRSGFIETSAMSSVVC